MYVVFVICIVDWNHLDDSVVCEKTVEGFSNALQPLSFQCIYNRDRFLHCKDTDTDTCARTYFAGQTKVTPLCNSTCFMSTSFLNRLYATLSDRSVWFFFNRIHNELMTFISPEDNFILLLLSLK